MRWTIAIGSIVLVSAFGVAGAGDIPTPPRSAAWAVMPGSGIGPVRLRMTKPEVLAVLGEPDRVPEGSEDSWWCYDRDGLMVIFELDIGEPFALILRGGSRHPEARENFRARTPDGIGIGSSRDDVIAAFGQPDPHEFEAGPLVFGSAGISFWIEDDRVTQIGVQPLRASASR